jgi:predicted regulator of Ras-like GTPase activity (Roadblock/LC7/MglB family)
MVLVTDQSAEAKNFGWLLNNFVQETPGVLYSVAVSVDGILMASSEGLELANAEQLAAIVSGMTSLAVGADRCFNANGVHQIIVEFGGGYLFITAMGAASCLGVLTDKDCDIGLVAYEMTLLVGRAAPVLTPELVAELKNLLGV